jgi:hypothetical protein
MTDYKKYSLEQLENFLYDAMSAEATPQEIYDTIRGVVSDNYYTYKHQASQAYELLSLLNGHRSVDLDFCDKDDTSEECVKSWSDFWTTTSYTEEEIDAMCAGAELEQDLRNVGNFLKQDRDSNFPGENTVKDKVKKWVLPVEEEGDDCVITFPDDLLEAANLKEGDQIEWIPQDNGSYLLKKIEVKN